MISQLAKLLPKVSRLLDNRVDRLVWQFRTSDPEFYEKYQVARAIVSASSAATEATPDTVPVVKAA